MIDPSHSRLSIVRQCELVSISRSSFYREPAAESEETLRLMRLKTQTVLPSADTAAMLFWALLASGQIDMRKVDGWQTLATKPIDQPIDLAA